MDYSEKQDSMKIKLQDFGFAVGDRARQFCLT